MDLSQSILFLHKSWRINFTFNIDGVNISSGPKRDETKIRIPRLLTGIFFSIGLKTMCHAQYPKIYLKLFQLPVTKDLS